MAFRGLSGNIPEVNDDHQLEVNSVTRDEIQFQSKKNGLAFSWASTFATGGTDVKVLYIKNTSSTRELVIDSIIVGAAAACVFTLFEVTSGTAAGTSITPQNLNLGKGNAANSTSYGNASVTGSLAGNNLAFQAVAASAGVVMPLQGALILGQNNEIAINASANTTVYVTVYGHYVDK